MELVRRLSPPIEEEHRAELIYHGAIVIFERVPAMKKLCAFSDELIRSTFGTTDPTTVQFEYEPPEYLALVTRLQATFKDHIESRRLFTRALRQIGVKLELTYWDKLCLRVLPHGAIHGGDVISGVGMHRDTWGSNLHQQTNWWAPVYPLAADRTIAFYPNYWATPLENTSGSWSVDQLLTHRRRLGGSAATYPIAPEPTEPVDTSSELRIVIEPGDMLCFSAAHLHASVPNRSGATRFSIDTRTVNIDDMRQGRSAPNIDCHATQPMVKWFKHISNGTPLSSRTDDAHDVR